VNTLHSMHLTVTMQMLSVSSNFICYWQRNGIEYIQLLLGKKSHIFHSFSTKYYCHGCDFKYLPMPVLCKDA